MTRGVATLVGFGAIALWSLLALLTDLSGEIPPFQLAAMTFAVGGASGLGVMLMRGRSVRVLIQPRRVWTLGVGGLFGYHFLYFSALRAAPTAEASLIAYLWPLLIVLFATFATGEKLRKSHLTGAMLGFLGAFLLISGPDGFVPSKESTFGYLLALAAAVVWAGYSVLSRRVPDVPTDAITGFCLATAIGAAGLHLVLEVTVWPSSPVAWWAIVGLGLGPLGLAFFVWDIGVKKGDLALLGAASYCAPLLSTLILVLVGRAEASMSLALACVFITAGAMIAASSEIAKLRA